MGQAELIFHKKRLIWTIALSFRIGFIAHRQHQRLWDHIQRIQQILRVNDHSFGKWVNPTIRKCQPIRQRRLLDLTTTEETITSDFKTALHDKQD